MATLPHDEQELEQEVLAPQAQTVDSATLAVLSKAEVDVQIATAKKYPRQISKLLSTAKALVTASTEIANEMIYALPRGNKIIEGPSVRFAEAMAYAWGNSRSGARIIAEDEEWVTAMGTFADLEQNVTIGYEVKRRIVNREGKRYNSDVIQQTANAACSIALRNAQLRGIPKSIWGPIYLEARRAVAGDIKTLDATRSAMIKAFELMGAKRDQIFSLLEVKGVEDITPDQIVSLRGIYNAIREGETTVARAFAPKDTQDTKLADKSQANLDKLKEKYSQTVTVPIPAGDQNKEVAVLDGEPKRELRVGPPPQKNGASQSPQQPEPLGKDTPVETAATDPKPVEARTVAPLETQEAEQRAESIPSPATGPETGACSGPVPVIEESFFPENEDAEPEQHGVPLGFNEPTKKSNRKR